jgi:hypothetical protein
VAGGDVGVRPGGDAGIAAWNVYAPAFRTLKYMGVVIHQPMPIAASANYFSAVAVAARVIKDPSGTAVLSNVYPSRMTVS